MSDYQGTMATARSHARQHNVTLIEALASVQKVPIRDSLAWLGQLLSLPILENKDLVAMQPAFDLLPLATAMQREALLVRDEGGNLLAAIANPFDDDLCHWLIALSQGRAILRLMLGTDLQAYLAQHEANTRAMDSLGPVSPEHLPSVTTSVEVLSFSATSDSSSPAIRLVSSTLYDGLREGASDIHLESQPLGLAVKYRIDGVIATAKILPGRELAQQAISRLKVLAGLDIAEQRVPQDGSFAVNVQGADIDMRLSIMPSIHGEDAVIRILDKRAMLSEHGSLTLDALGFDAYALRTLRKLAHLPYGMLLVTGPTGSGKTTTLYGALSEINTGRDKIVTIEDPVEYQLPGVLQIPVNDKKGLTFARGLRSILRHDPDKIMVGEIRDNETAAIAIQSAQTGHLVLTTVHANNVFEVFGRFTHMGIDLYALVHALTGVVAQRLVRLNCPHCTQPRAATEEERALLLEHGLPGDSTVQAGLGCGDCRGTGFRGRKAVAECLIMTGELRELIVAMQPMRVIHEAARRAGTRTLREGALALALQGETTFEEVNRVTLHV